MFSDWLSVYCCVSVHVRSFESAENEVFETVRRSVCSPVHQLGVRPLYSAVCVREFAHALFTSTHRQMREAAGVMRCCVVMAPPHAACNTGCACFVNSLLTVTQRTHALRQPDLADRPCKKK